MFCLLYQFQSTSCASLFLSSAIILSPLPLHFLCISLFLLHLHFILWANFQGAFYILSPLFPSLPPLRGLSTQQALKKGYALAIPGSWQGRYDTSTGISVIDKSGGMTAQVFRKNRKYFILLHQDLQNTVQMPIHVIRVVHNPYDNIATMLLYNEHQKFSVNETHKYEDEEGLDNQINSYFHQVRSVVEMIDELKLQVTEVHSKEFIANPKATLRKLCLTLHIDCSGEYLHMC